MTPLASAALLDVWERGCAESASRRSLALLALDAVEGQMESPRLTVGQRDARLLELRRSVFGTDVECRAQCPRCDTSLEVSVPLAGLADSPVREAGGAGSIRMDGYEVRFRPVLCADLEVLDTAASLEDNRRRLLERCVGEVRCEGRAAALDELPDAVVARVEQALAEADPQADLRLALRCEACGHGWELGFDIAEVLWREVDAWARRLLHEVHLLASAYGWREAEILALSPRRRRFYLERVEP